MVNQCSERSDFSPERGPCPFELRQLCLLRSVVISEALCAEIA